MDSNPQTIAPDPEAPFDPSHLDLKELGLPYKRADGTWTDGGTDTHAGTGGFRKGWTNNHQSQKRWLLQETLIRTVTLADIQEIISAMMTKAKKGDKPAAELVLAYTVGDPVTMELMHRMQLLEQAAGLKAGGQADAKADAEANSIVRELKLAGEKVA